jgi:hypothetical protein
MSDRATVSFTSPLGRGRRVAPGEGLCSIEKPYPLAPTLSPWERERTCSRDSAGVTAISSRPKSRLRQRRTALFRCQCIQKRLHRGPQFARTYQREIVMLLGERNEAEP